MDNLSAVAVSEIRRRAPPAIPPTARGTVEPAPARNADHASSTRSI